MGNLVFQATLGGQVNLVGPNTASTFNLNVPAVAGTLVTTGDTGTVTNTMLAGSIANVKLTNSSVTVGSTSIALGATSTTLAGLTGVTTSALTDSGLTSGRVTYASTGGLLADSANLTFNGTTLTTANDASISGLTVGKGAGSVSNNTAFGTSALSSNSAGSNITAVGYQALQTNTASSNDAFGSQALKANTSGSVNTAFGYASLYANTTGSYNCAFGSYSSGGTLFSNTTGSNNSAFGYQALQSNTTASNNTAVGYKAGYANTTGAENTAVGSLALNFCTTGTYNTAVGGGGGAGVNLTTGNGNTFVGAYSGSSVTTGSANTFVGCNATGYGAGYLITTGGKNTIIGGYSGNQGGLDIRTSSNYIVLSDGDGNPRWYNTGSVSYNIGGFKTLVNGASQINASISISEFVSSANSDTVQIANTNASFNGNNLLVRATRNTTNGSFTAISYYNDGAAAYKFIVYDSGNVVNTNNSYGAISDIKLKENIVDATPKLEDLCKVKVRNYNLKTDPTHKQLGVVAQELEEVFAGMVEESADKDQEGNDLGTTTKSVKYSVFVPMLIKAVQELKTIVDAQTAEIAELKAKVA